MDEYRKYCGTANTIGVPFEIVTPAEIAKLWPLCNTEGLVGALYHPDDGHIAPADVTQAMATGARNLGAEIFRDTPVTALERKPNGEWLVRTTRGDIGCEHVVCATGNYSWHTSRMLGIYIPAIPVEHQYIVTDEVPELVQRHQPGSAGNGGAARIGCLLLPAGRTPGLYPWALRKRRAGPVLGRRSRQFRTGPVPRGSGTVVAPSGGGDRPGAQLRAGGHQGHRQRSDRLYARRQPPGGAGMEPAQCMAERGPQLRHHGGGRRRLAARGMDRRGRAVDRHDGCRSAQVRSLCQQALCEGQERRSL